MQYAIEKRQKRSICNLCRLEADLTWDHVPPKGGTVIRPMEMQAMMTRLTAETGKTVISQNGVKFRTICKKCNEHLGAQYDATLNEFSRSVGLYLKSTLRLPMVLTHVTKPQRLLKAVLAHLVAAKVEIEDTTFDQLARTYALDPSAQLPDDIHVFYWVYPYDDLVVMRDFAMFVLSRSFDMPAVFQLMKCFPVAFLCSTASNYAGLNSLSAYRHCALDEEVEIPLRLFPVRERHWPETPDDRYNKVIFGGASAMRSVYAAPRRATRAMARRNERAF
ncbi:hypothetical protein AUC70_13190 [Methyloceanibacter stevinii]|uniref:HNH endonuclease 5 domain-containing protein n=1 Tax=Methyloceanibacter stevinii TaxID=1774970 RepID=A0A1E3VUK6_9HYPH|nr:hypothetical protein [Methyloceanibacter stevinii]ODR97207.1 hypothetical protein AUC70_13190 [Methyloceanibacter stevinii]